MSFQMVLVFQGRGSLVANFLVLVWLLKRFLYRPILDGIDARPISVAEKAPCFLPDTRLATAK